MIGPDPIPGTWDGMADAVDILNKSGLVFVLTVAMENSQIARTRTNAGCPEGFDWLADRHAANVKKLREEWE